jgi:ABC-type glycerol-3-phosphate transport system permease component
VVDAAPVQLSQGEDGRQGALLRSAYSSESYGPIMAGAALSALPLLVVFVVANRRIVEGVRLSGLKG